MIFYCTRLFFFFARKTLDRKLQHFFVALNLIVGGLLDQCMYRAASFAITLSPSGNSHQYQSISSLDWGHLTYHVDSQ